MPIYFSETDSTELYLPFQNGTKVPVRQNILMAGLQVVIRRLRPLSVFMSTPGPKTQMDPQKEAEISHLWKNRGSPDQSLGNRNNCSLQQRNKVTTKAEAHRALSLIHISEPTRRKETSRMPSSA